MHNLYKKLPKYPELHLLTHLPFNGLKKNPGEHDVQLSYKPPLQVAQAILHYEQILKV